MQLNDIKIKSHRKAKQGKFTNISYSKVIGDRF
jgi:hypothetical protein